MSSYLLDITLIDIQDNLMRGYITKKTTVAEVRPIRAPYERVTFLD